MWDGQIAALCRPLSGHRLGHARPRPIRRPGRPRRLFAGADGRRHGGGARCLRRRAGVVGGLSLGGVMSLAFHIAHPGAVPRADAVRHRPGFSQPEARAAMERARRGARPRARSGGIGGAGRRSRDGLGTHRSARGLAGAARGMLAQFDASLIDRFRRSASRPLYWSAATIRISWPPPITWPARSAARERSSSRAPATPPISISPTHSIRRSRDSCRTGLPATTRCLSRLIAITSRRCRTATWRGFAKSSPRISCARTRTARSSTTAFLAQTARPVTISGLSIDDVKIRILGDVAIIHARTSYGLRWGTAARPLHRRLGAPQRHLASRLRARDAVARNTQEPDRLRLNRHSLGSGIPGLPLHRSPGTPAFAGVTEARSI